jgi:hypothetical protein
VVPDATRKNINGTETKNLTTKQSRRHAGSVLVFTRSPQPGCRCPPPGKPDGNKVSTKPEESVSFQT